MPLRSTRGAASSRAYGFTSGGAKPYDNITVFAVAGGGSGGGKRSGGGGAGGATEFAAGTKIFAPKSSYSVVIGAGGPRFTQTVGQGEPGYDGSASSFESYDLVTKSIVTETQTGGGRGGARYGNANQGGSGGGAGRSDGNGSTSGAPGISGEGFAGGNENTSQGGAGGGGGSGNGNDGNGGTGGPGLQFSINSTYYAGGGGGGSGGSGGIGGGGGQQSDGQVNTGGGSGGCPDGNYNPSTGGSGIVMFAYPGPQKHSGGSVSTVGGYTVHTFTDSGTFTTL